MISSIHSQMTFIHKKTFIHEKTFIQRGRIVGLLGLVCLSLVLFHDIMSFCCIYLKGRCSVEYRGEFPDVRPSICPSPSPNPPPPPSCFMLDLLRRPSYEKCSSLNAEIIMLREGLAESASLNYRHAARYQFLTFIFYSAFHI